MSDIQIIVALFTLVGWAVSAIKMRRKYTRWFWNTAPFICGFTSCLWLALILG